MNPADYFDRFMSIQAPTSSLICSAEGDPPGGGSGSGSGESVFTDVQREELNKMMNAASSTHATRIEKRFDTKLAESTTAITTAMSEGFANIGKPKDPPKDPPPKVPPKAGESEAVTTMRTEHEARMKEMENKFKASEDLRVTEADAAKVTDERSKLTAALRTAGVPDGLLKGAVAQLYAEDQRIARDKDGKVIYKAQREGFVDELSLKDGIAEWMKSDEGKHYAPARGAGGSGAIGGGKQRQGNGEMTKAEKKREAKHELVRAVIMDGR